MQTWEAITSRRNVRSFDGRPIAATDLDRILEAGRRAPSSQNWQPWDFILVTRRETLRELAQVWRGAGHVAESAATIVVVGPAADNEFHRAQFDLGQATMAMTLAAADLGVGSCHAGVADLLLAGPTAARAAKAIVREVRGLGHGSSKWHTARVIARQRVSEEAREGFAAFDEKRRPSWAPPED